MDWAAAERRSVPGSVEAALWEGLRRIIGLRRATRATHAQGTGRPLWTGNDHVYGLLRTFAGDRLLVLANFSALEQRVRDSILAEHGIELPTEDGELVLAPYQYAWLHAR
jgi:amylosucrase